MRIGTCKHCKQKKEIKARGLCEQCYDKLRHSSEFDKYPIHKPRMIKCKCCKKIKKHHARGLCYNCYQNETQIRVGKGNVYVPLGTKNELEKYKNKKKGEFFDDVLDNMGEFLKRC